MMIRFTHQYSVISNLYSVVCGLQVTDYSLQKPEVS